MAKKKKRGGARPGAGRKPGPEGPTSTVAFSAPVSLMEKLDALAAKREWNRSEAITEAIRSLLANENR